MTDERLRILVIGAHPDDCDIYGGGTAALWRASGHEVRFVSVTNGESGHHETSGEPLVRRRRAEARAAGEVLGIRYDVLDNRDGYLQPTLESRFEIIGLIRKFNPDLILTHRPNDYHPDHRYTSQLVCDAAYMVMVPAVVPDVPALRRNPVIAYLPDLFERPYRLAPTVVVDIEPVLEQVVDMLDCHVSQFYEWLPYVLGMQDPVPTNPAERREWLKQLYLARIAPLADRHHDVVTAVYGPERAARIRYIEAFEPCEYGSLLDADAQRRLFPFVPSDASR
ncbi:MAG: PIG-L deacetylase family protein [Planctomycetaceae bacterium]